MSRQAAQSRLVQAIWSGAADAAADLQALGCRGLGPHDLARGLAAYREHAKALSVRALGAAFARVQAWLGAPDFAGLAWAFARHAPPQQGDLARWGAELPAFVAALPEVEPELPALAQLDWSLHALAWQADEAAAPAAELLQALQQQGDAGLLLSARLQSLQLPATALSCAAAVGPPAWPEPATVAAGGARELLVWRAGWQPCWAVLPAGWGLWLRQLQAGASLGEAIDAVLAGEPGFDAGQALHTALDQAWVLGLQAGTP